MKPITNLLLFMLAVVLLSHCEKDEPDPEVKIPDNNFLKALVALGVDADGDGRISHTEAELITFLNVGDFFIKDLTGIEAFVNLDTLYCYSNELTTLDVSGNSGITWLYLKDMPSLYKVCVWEMPFPPAGVNLFRSGSPNVYFTTDCN